MNIVRISKSRLVAAMPPKRITLYAPELRPYVEAPAPRRINGKVVTSSGIVIGGAYSRPAASQGVSDDLVQSALLDQRTLRKPNLFVAVLVAIYRFL